MRRAMGALPMAPSAAIAVLRSLLGSGTRALLEMGEIALKEALPKVRTCENCSGVFRLVGAVVSAGIDRGSLSTN